MDPVSWAGAQTCLWLGQHLGRLWSQWEAPTFIAGTKALGTDRIVADEAQGQGAGCADYGGR